VWRRCSKEFFVFVYYTRVCVSVSVCLCLSVCFSVCVCVCCDVYCSVKHRQRWHHHQSPCTDSLQWIIQHHNHLLYFFFFFFISFFCLLLLVINELMNQSITVFSAFSFSFWSSSPAALLSSSSSSTSSSCSSPTTNRRCSVPRHNHIHQSPYLLLSVILLFTIATHRIDLSLFPLGIIIIIIINHHFSSQPQSNDITRTSTTWSMTSQPELMTSPITMYMFKPNRCSQMCVRY